MRVLSLGGLCLVMAFGLSGCITVACKDGTRAKDAFGMEVKAKDWDEEAVLNRKYCPQDYQTPDLSIPVNPAPVPTNLGPAVGAVGLAGAALLGGGGTGPVSTTSTR